MCSCTCTVILTCKVYVYAHEHTHTHTHTHTHFACISTVYTSLSILLSEDEFGEMQSGLEGTATVEVVEIPRDQVSVFVDEVIRNALSAYQMEVVAQKRRKAQEVSSHRVPRDALVLQVVTHSVVTRIYMKKDTFMYVWNIFEGYK